MYCLQLIKEIHNPNLTELAEKLSITKPSTTAIIEKLEQKGYIIKIKSDIDRRSAHVHLTGKGENAGQLHERVHNTFARLLAKELTESEKNILIVLLNKAVKAFD